MMESPMQIKVVGVSGGTVRNSNTAGIVYNGLGNKDYNYGRWPFNVKGIVGNIVTGDKNKLKGSLTTTQSAQNQSVRRKELRRLSSSELEEQLIKAECSEETVKSFSMNKITGRLFLDLDDDMSIDLNISDKIEKRKLRSLHADLKQR